MYTRHTQGHTDNAVLRKSTQCRYVSLPLVLLRYVNFDLIKLFIANCYHSPVGTFLSEH